VAERTALFGSQVCGGGGRGYAALVERFEIRDGGLGGGF
jgi:hypothetical protein